MTLVILIGSSANTHMQILRNEKMEQLNNSDTNDGNPAMMALKAY